jgi:DeoR family transcriptional regulator of aga operon
MIGMAKKVIVVTDSRKFLRRRFAFIAPITKVHTVITDSGIPEEDKSRLKNLGIELIIV